MKSVWNAETSQYQFYLAPMEGVTGYVYRNAYHKHFQGMDKYITPFIPPNENRCMNFRERNDILPENNEGLMIVPQILTNVSEYFIRTAKELKTYGYDEININLGCPSGTVTAKGKGAGFLAKPEELDRFLADIFDALDMKISVKTRLGMADEAEFEQILDIYNKYPIYELMIHPRVRQDFYKGEVRLDAFEKAAANTNLLLCYNGDIKDLESFEKISERIAHTNTTAMMLGRGVIGNPFLMEDLLQKKTRHGIESREEMDRFMAFMRDLEAGYVPIMSGDKNLLYRMKEVWGYLSELFFDNPKQLKKIKKTSKLEEYHQVLKELENTSFQ